MNTLPKFNHRLLVSCISLCSILLFFPARAQTFSEEELLSVLMTQEIDSNNNEEPDSLQISELQRSLREYLALAELAKKQGIADSRPMKARLYLQESQLLAIEYLRRQVQAYQPTDEDLRAVYDEQVSSFTEYHLRHILLKTEEQAIEVIKQLDRGVAFTKLAKKSLDYGNKNKGGDLGWARLNTWVPEFAEAAAKLKKGEYSGIPAKAQFGYHVILMVDEPRVPKDLPPFELVRAQLIELAKQKYLGQIQKNALVSP